MRSALSVSRRVLHLRERLLITDRFKEIDLLSEAASRNAWAPSGPTYDEMQSKSNNAIHRVRPRARRLVLDGLNYRRLFWRLASASQDVLRSTDRLAPLSGLE